MGAARQVLHALVLAELRVRQGVAAKLGWIVALGFFVGLGAALWAPGADDATRAATADRMALGAVGGLAMLAALISAATTIPTEIVDGSADRLLASPVSRIAVIVGGVLGHGALASLVLIGGLGAALLGLDAGGLGSGVRRPAREYVVVNPTTDVIVTRATGSAELELAIAPEAIPADELVLRVKPRAVNEGGELERITHVPLVLSQPGGEILSLDAGWAPGREIVARFPVAGIDPSLPLRLTVHRPTGSWGIAIQAGTLEAGGPPQLFLTTALQAAACLVPLLFLVAAAGSLGASRFGTPTALGVAFFLLTLFAGQDVLRDGAEYVVRAAAAAEEYADEGHHEGDGHDHGDHEHAPSEVSALQLRLARLTLSGLDLLPPLEAFDRTDEILAGRAVPVRDGGRAAVLVLPGLVVLLGASWLLMARRDLLPT